MGGSDLALVLESISQLDADLARLRTHADDLGAGEAKRSTSSSLASLRAVLGRAVITMRDLRTQVIERPLQHDRSSDESRRFTLVASSSSFSSPRLKEAERELPPGFWDAGRMFSSITDVSTYICREIGRVNSAYLAERRRAHAEDRETIATAIATAEIALDAIGRDPDLACFIAAGASVRCERFRTACRMIALLLEVPLAPESDLRRRASIDLP